MPPRCLTSLVLAGAALASLLGGCVPVEHLDASPVAGQVVDRATVRPVAGAAVVLSVSNPDREARTRTDRDGRFQFPGFRHVEFVPLPYAMYRAPTGYLHVEADGYQSYDQGEFFGDGGGPGYSHQRDPGRLQQVRVALVHGKGRSSSSVRR